jgi:hypothetical protein
VLFQPRREALSFFESRFTLKYQCILSALSFADADGSGNAYSEISYKMGYGKLTPLLIGGHSLKRYQTMTWHIIPIIPISSEVDQKSLVLSLSNFTIPMKGGECMASLTVYSDDSASSSKLFDGCDKTYNNKNFMDNWIFIPSKKALVVFKVSNSDIGKPNIVNFQLTWNIDSPRFRCGALLQPDSLIDNSMMVFDGSEASDAARTGAHCEWRIQPRTGTFSDGVRMSGTFIYDLHM